MTGTWIPVSQALPMYEERVLIPTPKRVEIARRVEARRTVPSDIAGPAPSFVWELDYNAETYHPRQITHWMSIPSKP